MLSLHHLLLILADANLTYKTLTHCISHLPTNHLGHHVSRYIAVIYYNYVLQSLTTTLP